MYHIIINPASRSGRGLKIWKAIIEPALHKEGITYRSYFSEKAGDVVKLTEKITNSEDSAPLYLLILGGDGTVNEALQGIQNPSKVILGYIPTGSSNDLARDLGIPKAPLDALNCVLHTGTIYPMDLGTVTYSDGETRRFAVSCGIGFDAAVCEEALHSRIKTVFNKIGLGKLTYLGIALKQLLTAKRASCEIYLDEEKPIYLQKIMFVASMIHKYEGGGFQFCPDAIDNDGIFSLCTVGDIPIPTILVALPTAFKGKHYKFKGITPYSASKVRIKTSLPLWVHTDGEVTRKAQDFTLSCEKEALSIIR